MMQVAVHDGVTSVRSRKIGNMRLGGRDQASGDGRCAVVWRGKSTRNGAQRWEITGLGSTGDTAVQIGNDVGNDAGGSIVVDTRQRADIIPGENPAYEDNTVIGSEQLARPRL